MWLALELSPAHTTAYTGTAKSFLNTIILITILPLYKCQFYPTMASYDDFETQMCRERTHRLDWNKLLEPCIGRTVFGKNLLPSTLRTHPLWSRILTMDIKNAGEYSKIVLQTVDQVGRLKTIGGDSWRVMITGSSSLQPVVFDMNNGQYEIPFLILEPGAYKAFIYLEGTLCSQLFDPPSNWFKKGDYNGHFQEAHMFKNKPGWGPMLKERMWERLGGNSSVIQFQVSAANEVRFAANQAKLRQWKTICNVSSKCDYVWDGFGRWVSREWKPYNNQEGMTETPSLADLQQAYRKKRGVLWFYGDCFAYHFYEMERNQTLCTDVFKKCGNSYNWIYPRLNANPDLDTSIHFKDPSDISMKKILRPLRKILRRPDMNEDSAIVLNFGLHFARATSFENYKKLIVGIIKELASYDGQVVWRTTTSVWRQQWKVHKRFQTYQRVQLFNAFASSTFCNAGYPVLDVFPMTSSVSYQPKDGIHYESWVTRPLEQVYMNYFKDDELS